VSTIAGLLPGLLQLALMLAVAPVLAGGADWLRARLAGRAGPPPLQYWRDLVRLARKDPVLPANASWLFRAAPAVVLAATIAAAALVPAFALPTAAAPLADLLLLVGLLALARAVLLLAGLDAGTAIGGLGASRLAATALPVAPALFAALLALGLLAGGTNLVGVLRVLRGGSVMVRLPALLAVAALLPVALAALGRAPLADPAGRHETGLLQGAVAFAYSARHLALLRAAAALELLLWLTVLGNLCLPFGLVDARPAPLAWLLAAPLWGLKLAAGGAALAVLEARTVTARPERLAAGCGLAVLLGVVAVLLCCLGQGQV
jgi:formate hydrogenlyase subunit 4